MAGQKYNKAYEAYQQAVYRDGRNPTFWCSIGVLYFQINQYRDALDAYSRAIRINPYISEVWFDLGSLYESCNNQISDAIDAYARAAELDPSNQAIAQRLQLLKNAQATGQTLPAAPGPQDVHPTAYANTIMPQPAGLSGPPLLLHSNNGLPSRPLFRADSRGAPNDLPLPIPPAQLPGRSSPGPFRGGPPPPVILDDNQRPQSHVLAPMDIDRPPLREAASFRDGRGPSNSLMLHHPVAQPQAIPQSHPHENFAPRPIRMPSGSASPPVRQLPSLNDRPPVGPGQIPPHTRSPRVYPRDVPPERAEPGWDRRIPPGPERDWDQRDHRGRPGPPEYAAHPPQPPMYASRPHSPIFAAQAHRNVSRDRRETPPEASPRSAHPGYPRSSSSYWDAKHSGPSAPGPSAPMQMPPRAHSPPSREVVLEPPSRRYDPRFDSGRESQPREYEREAHMEQRYHAASPEAMRMRAQPPPPPFASSASMRTSESPRIQQESASMPMLDPKARGRRKAQQDVEMAAPGQEVKKERKKRQRRSKEDTPQPGMPPRQDSQYSMAGPSYRQQKTSSNGSPEPSSNGSNGSGVGSANRSTQPSPTGSISNPAHHPPTRVVDEDYDGDGAAAEVLMNMASTPSYRTSGPNDPRSFGAPVPQMRSPPDNRSRHQQMSPHAMSKHPAMAGRTSPSSSTSKRPLSPGPEDPSIEAKRSRVGSMSRRMSSPNPTGTASSRPSPIPFRQQPTSHSPEIRQGMERERAPSYPPSPALPTMLPPHPRPIGTMGALAGQGHTSGPGMPLPPLATTNRSPPHVSPTDSERMRERERERERDSRSNSPNAQRGLPAKREIVMHPAGSPQGAMPKGTPSPASSHGSHGSGGSHKMVS